VKSFGIDRLVLIAFVVSKTTLRDQFLATAVAIEAKAGGTPGRELCVCFWLLIRC
jgi:hypothetical protein